MPSEIYMAIASEALDDVSSGDASFSAMPIARDRESIAAEHFVVLAILLKMKARPTLMLMGGGHAPTTQAMGD